MASGSWSVSTSNSYISGTLSWSSVSNTAGNYSDVTATLRLSRTNTGYTTESRGTFTLVLDGTSYTETRTTNPLFTFTYNSNTLCITATKRVNHNTDGKKAVSITASFGGTGARFTMSSQGGTATLDTIPRYATINSFTVNNISRDRGTVNWTANSTINYWWYSINGGSTWVAVGNPSSTSGSRVITGLSAGASYTFRVKVRRSDSNLETLSPNVIGYTNPLASVYSVSLYDRTCTSIRVFWKANNTVINAQYSLNGGGWQNGYTSNFGATTEGYFWINGLSPNTTYGIRVRALDGAHTSSWSGASGTTNMATFRLNTSPGASFSTGNSVAISLSRATTSIYSDVTLQVQNNNNSYINIATLSNQTASASFSLNATQLNTIYSNRVNAKTTPLRFMIVNRWGSSGAVQGTSYSSVGTCTIANANPTIASVSYKDTNNVVKEILNYEAEGANLLAGTSSNWETIAFSGEYYQQFFHPEVKLEVGETYTFSVVIEKVSADSIPINIHLGLGTTAYQYDVPNWRENAITFGQKVSLTHTITEVDLRTFSGFFAWRIRNEQKFTTIRFKEAKLEKGNTATSWVVRKEPKILRNLSTLQVITGQATSQKYATLKSYKVSIGGGEYTTNTSGTSETGKVVNIGKVNQSANQTAILTATDSRGYTASRSFTVQMLDYLPPQFIQASADRLNSYEEETTLNVESRRAIVRPLDLDVNEIEMRYRIKENPSGIYGGYINLTSNSSNTIGLWKSFITSQYMADYPSNKSYTVELGIKDKFTSWNNILITLTEGIALLRFLQDKIVSGVPIEIGSEGEALKLIGAGDNRAWLSFYDNNKTTRRGYVGFGGVAQPNDLQITNDSGGTTHFVRADNYLFDNIVSVGHIESQVPTEQIAYSYDNGCLIDLAPDSRTTYMILIEVTGNGYSTGIPIKTLIQAYHYQPKGSLLQCKQLNLGQPIAAAKFFLNGGRLQCWFKQSGAYQTLRIKVTSQSSNETGFTITNAVEPTGTNKVTCSVRNLL